MKTLKTKELKNGRLAMVSPLPVSLEARGLSFVMKDFPNTWQRLHTLRELVIVHVCRRCVPADFAGATQLAVFGYGAQAVITGEGPWKNLTDHLSKPAAYNILTNLGHPAL